MKAVLDLTKAITDYRYFGEQFIEKGNEKNILFVAPQLTSKHLYKFILPFFSFYNNNVFTAITSLKKFNPYEQIVRLDVELNPKELLWANFIVIPFTTQDLTKEFGIYEAIREVNPKVQIVFFIDFNFYELPKNHEYYDLFTFENIISQTEKNILKCDLCLTTNEELDKYMFDKFSSLAKEKYQKDDIFVNFAYLPIFIDKQIVTQNKEVDWDTELPIRVINRESTIKVAEVAEKIKKKDLKSNKTKTEAKKIKSAKSAPKPIKTKVIKVKSTDDKIDKASPEVSPSSPVEIKKPEPKTLDKVYTMGVIVNSGNCQDVLAFKDEFIKINQIYGSYINIVFYGYDYKGDKSKVFKGLDFGYVPPVSIIHYFKQLESLKLDFVVIPLVKNTFNITSEDTNKYLECGIFGVPTISPDFFPYSKEISEKRNGYLYKEKSDLLNTIEDMFSNIPLIKHIGEQAKADVLRNHSFTDDKIELMSGIYGEKQQ